MGVLAAILILFLVVFTNGNQHKKELADNIAKNLRMENEKIAEVSEAVFTITSKLLKAEGFQSNIMLIDSKNPKPYIEAILTDEREISSTEKQAIQKLVSDTMYAKTNIVFNVTVRTWMAAERLDNEWQPILSAIREAADQKFEEYRGFAYSFSPAPLQIIIKTDLKKSKKSSNFKKVEQIEEYVEGIIALKREELAVENLPYKIIVRSKDNETLN